MESTRQHSHHQACSHAALAGVLMFALVPAASFADGARTGHTAQPGEIVLTRNVATRPADRQPTAPGTALLVSVSPNPQLGNAINSNYSSGEITDAEIAGLNAGLDANAGISGQTTVQRSLNTALGTNSGGSSAGVANNGVSNVVSGALGGGAIADSTRGIGDQITSAVSQIPMPGTGH